MTGLTFEHLYSEKVRFLVRAGHPLLAERPFDLGRIRDYTVLVPPPGAVIQPFVERLLIANGIGRLPDTIETVSPASGASTCASPTPCGRFRPASSPTTSPTGCWPSCRSIRAKPSDRLA